MLPDWLQPRRSARATQQGSRQPFAAWLVFLLFAFLANPTPNTHAQIQPASPILPLFSESYPENSDPDDSPGLPTNSHSISYRRLNPYLMLPGNGFHPESPRSLQLRLNLSPTLSVIASLEENAAPQTSTTAPQSWHGNIQGYPGSLVLLSVSQQSAAATVFIPGLGTYQIQPAPNTWHRISALDPSLPYSCSALQSPEPHPHTTVPTIASLPTPPSSSASSSSLAIQATAFPPAPADLPASDPVLDLLVIYSENAREGAGSVAGMEALIDVAVAEVNQAFQNSSIHARLNLVHAGEMNFLESGSIADDLKFITDPDSDDHYPNEFLHDIHEMRQKYRADLVCLIAENTGESIGVANLMTDLDIRFGKQAYCIIQRASANAYFALAHEIGHNLGCQHDRPNSFGPGLFPYSHAHRFTLEGIQYHTIMSYQPGLPIPYFSNPDVLFQGIPTGVPESETNSANNAQTINLSAPVAALFDRVLKPSRPPIPKLISPTAGTRFFAPAIVELVAEVTDPDGTITEVEFYANSTKIASLNAPPYRYLWTNTLAGAFAIRVEAEDDTGNEVYSPFVTLLFTYPQPHLEATQCGIDKEGAFLIHIQGNTGQDFMVERSDDLVLWRPWLTNRFEGPIVIIKDSTPSTTSGRYYRVSEWMEPPPEHE